MNREALIDYAYNPSEHLTVRNESYKQWVFRYTFLELEKDLGTKGDITTQLFDDFDKVVSARIVCKENGIVAGLSELRYFLCDSDVNFRPRLQDEFELKLHFQDGAGIKKGDVLLEIKARAAAILAVERVILNFLGRMSGVATNAAKIAYEASALGLRVAGTRKTLWGALDKRALYLGGALPHRLNLADAIIVKDTHLDLIDRSFPLLFKILADKKPECRFIEVEALDSDEAFDVARMICVADLKQLGIVMFDNMSPAEIGVAMTRIKKAGYYDDLLFEASGGIVAENLAEYANLGIDVLSMGGLTNNAKSLDFSLKM